MYQIYYVFAFSSVGRQIVPFLRKLGLNCTEPTKNSAYGTVSTLIFFENIYLELFWSEETSHLAQSDMLREFNFLARVNWLETGASPFGFGLSYPTGNDNFFASTVETIRTDQNSTSEQLVQFCPINLSNPEEPICYLITDYQAKRNRLNRSLTISSRWHCVVCEGRRYAARACACACEALPAGAALPEGSALPEGAADLFEIAKQIMNPNLGMRKLTHVKLRVISDQLSLLALCNGVLATPLESLGAQNLLDIEYKKHPLLELTFDDGNQKKFVDLRPLIPIVLRS